MNKCERYKMFAFSFEELQCKNKILIMKSLRVFYVQGRGFQQRLQEITFHELCK